MIIMVTGGARSGKSRFAELYAQHIGQEGIYIATAAHIAKHQSAHKASPMVWTTVEEPYELSEQLTDIRIESRSSKAKQRIILVDCLTLWLSNCMRAIEAEKQEAAMQEKLVRDKLEQLFAVLQKMEHDVILVTNEVGDGQFRDWAGLMNQQVAQISRQVFLVTAGIPVEIKSQAFRFEQLD